MKILSEKECEVIMRTANESVLALKQLQTECEALKRAAEKLKYAILAVGAGDLSRLTATEIKLMNEALKEYKNLNK